jgi:hypothetical protein
LYVDNHTVNIQDFVLWKTQGIEEVCGEARAETYQNRNRTLKVSPKTKFAQSSINAMILDTIVNELVHDLAEPEFKEGN